MYSWAKRKSNLISGLCWEHVRNSWFGAHDFRMWSVCGTQPNNPDISAYMEPPAAFEVRSHPTKGRGLYAARLIQGGEVVIQEAAPLVLMVSPDHSHFACANCLRMSPAAAPPGEGPGVLAAAPPQQPLPCGGCGQACFCSMACQQVATATSWIHGPGICR